MVLRSCSHGINRPPPRKCRTASPKPHSRVNCSSCPGHLCDPSFFDPEFEVINRSSETVSVFAAWRGGERDIGEILPQSSHQFSVDDEAAMTTSESAFQRPGDRASRRMSPRGTKVIATISVTNAVGDFET